MFNDLNRVILVVLDGLRPDAISTFALPNLQRLSRIGAFTMRGRTVTPSETWPALTTLLTGVPPAVHGIVGSTLYVPRARTTTVPLPEVLLRAGYASHAFMEELPLLHRVFGGRIAERLGFSRATFAGTNAAAVLFAARKTLMTERRGFVFMHWADADRAGHRGGWMSPDYQKAAMDIDAVLGTLASWIDVINDPHTLLIALADHGGGGMNPREHEADHPLNARIPMVFVRGGIAHRELAEVRLEDIPLTIAWMLGAQVPEAYSGLVIADALESVNQTLISRPYNTSAVPMARSWPTITSPG